MNKFFEGVQFAFAASQDSLNQEKQLERTNALFTKDAADKKLVAK